MQFPVSPVAVSSMIPMFAGKYLHDLICVLQALRIETTHKMIVDQYLQCLYLHDIPMIGAISDSIVSTATTTFMITSILLNITTYHYCDDDNYSGQHQYDCKQ